MGRRSHLSTHMLKHWTWCFDHRRASRVLGQSVYFVHIDDQCSIRTFRNEFVAHRTRTILVLRGQQAVERLVRPSRPVSIMHFEQMAEAYQRAASMLEVFEGASGLSAPGTSSGVAGPKVLA